MSTNFSHISAGCNRINIKSNRLDAVKYKMNKQQNHDQRDNYLHLFWPAMTNILHQPSFKFSAAFGNHNSNLKKQPDSLDYWKMKNQVKLYKT